MSRPTAPTSTLSYATRANIPSTPPLASYLLRLMTHKHSNLALSADVTTTSQLLSLADACGPHIVILKTHADIIRDFSERTIAGLTSLARKHKFLLFEDRKFGDIGNTVQAQYEGGVHRIANWASLVNAHVFPGPGIVEGLKAAAGSALARLGSQITTEIRGGAEISEELETYIREERERRRRSGLPPLLGDSSEGESTADEDAVSDTRGRDRTGDIRNARKGSVVSVSTTISSSVEYISPPATATHASFSTSAMSTPSPTPRSTPFLDLPVGADSAPGPAPFARGLLLLAQMSSKGNLMTREYTDTCYEMATQHRDFVIGFIAQEGMNRKEGDNFLTLTPGVSLPSKEETDSDDEKKKGKASRRDHKGDALGQQYNTPRHTVLEKGVDAIIVGRGIMNAEDRAEEAKRYQKEAWGAYLERIGESDE